MKNQTKIAFVHAEHGHNDKGIGAGITEYVRDKGSWQLIAWPDPTYESLSFLKKQGCVGAIVNIQLAATAKQLFKVGIPIIAYSTLQKLGNTPYISTDSDQVTKMAFDYFSMKQFKNFAYFGLTEARWTKERLDSFSELVTRAGHELLVFKPKPRHITHDLPSFIKLWIDSDMTEESQQLLEWLKQIPKPVAVLASCDILGCFLSTFVQESGLSIPDDVAILGIDNDESICNICTAPLSSIALNLNKAGYEAARLLDHIIAGEDQIDGQRIKIEPVHIVERASTSIFAIEDEDVIKAMQYIYAYSHEPLQVSEIANHVCISKQSLQWKFKHFLNHSIHEVVVQAHFQKARAMLLETNLSIEEIALQSGFGSSAKMRKAFLDITGLLPHKYRQIHQPNK